MFGLKLVTEKSYNKLVDANDKVTYYKRETVDARDQADRYNKRYNELSDDQERALHIQQQLHQMELDRLIADQENAIVTIELKKDKEWNARLREAEGKALGKEAEVKGLQEVVKAKEDAMKRLNEQMEYLCTLIPKFDLSALSVTVTNNQSNDATKTK